MDTTPPKHPVEALEDFLDALRHEIRSNEELAHRLVQALGANIELRGSNAANVLNPIELVARVGIESAKQTLSSFSLSELKKIAKSNHLASSIDLQSRDQDGIVNLIVERSRNKIAERGAG